MAAGSNVYSNKKETVFRDGTYYDVFYAKELSEYVNLNNVKSLFHLDYVFQSVVDGENVFIGGVIENSSNFYYHKTTRLSVLGIQENGINYILLNDAGLNTFASVFCSLGRYKNANYIELNFYARSAYYSVTERFGFYYRLDGGEWYKYAHPAGSLSAKAIYNSPLIVNYIAYQAGQRIDIRPFALNDEGEKTFDMFSFVTDDYIHHEMATKIYSLSDDPSDNPATEFFFTETSFRNMGYITNMAGMYDILIYSDPTMSTPVPDGLYHIMFSPISGENYQDGQLGKYTGNKAVIEIYNGRVQKWDEGYWITPGPTPTVYIGVTAELQGSDPFESNYFKYTIHIQNNMLVSTGDLSVEVWSYRQLAGGPGNVDLDLIPYTKLGTEIISAPPKQGVVYRSELSFFAGVEEIAVGLRANLGSNVQLAGPALIPGRGPRPEE